MTDTYDPDPPVGLGAVMETELRYIVANSPMPDRDARMRALDRLLERERAREATDEIAAERLREAVFADEDIHLTGLAFSGGGIRSASFGLGVLQSLSRAGLLSRFDYLSGVSGGGYILGWLLAWSYRTKGGLPAVERSLADRTEAREPEPIRHLRRYVMYLAPKSGMLSTDLWGLLAAYLRNLCVTLTFALPLLLIPILVCHLLFAGLRLTVESSPGWWRHLGFAAILVPARSRSSPCACSQGMCACFRGSARPIRHATCSQSISRSEPRWPGSTCWCPGPISTGPTRSSSWWRSRCSASSPGSAST
ncbi:MAG: patatin-like phospholipase family protein [Burkholderiaceae bacterium]